MKPAPPEMKMANIIKRKGKKKWEGEPKGSPKPPPFHMGEYPPRPLLRVLLGEYPPRPLLKDHPPRGEPKGSPKPPPFHVGPPPRFFPQGFLKDHPQGSPPRFPPKVLSWNRGFGGCIPHSFLYIHFLHNIA